MRPLLKTILVLAFNIVIVSLVFGVAECSARVLAYRQLRSPSGRTELILDRWTAFRNNPNYQTGSVRLNDEGFRRDRSVLPDKSRDTIRIFLLGGSTAYGGDTLYPELDNHWTIDNHQTIDYYLEQRLNTALPQKRWEVINAAVKGYFLNQNLALFLSTIQQYKPDYLILLDGVNDFFVMLQHPGPYDGYREAGLRREFDALTRPGDLSLKVMASTWMLNNSALYRLIRDKVGQRNRNRVRGERVRKEGSRLDFGGLTPAEQTQYRAAPKQFDNYLHTSRQIHRVAAVDGIPTLFVLQPQLAVTRKQLTSTEKALLDYWWKVDGTLYVYGFQTLYTELAKTLASDARQEGYGFLDLTGVFDSVTAQTFTDYCHLTPVGNQAVADAIFGSLEGPVRERIAAAVR